MVVVQHVYCIIADIMVLIHGLSTVVVKLLTLCEMVNVIECLNECLLCCMIKDTVALLVFMFSHRISCTLEVLTEPSLNAHKTKHTMVPC